MIRWNAWVRIGLMVAIAVSGMSQTFSVPNTPTASVSDTPPFFGGALINSSRVLMVGTTSTLPKRPWRHSGQDIVGVEKKQTPSSGDNNSNVRAMPAYEPDTSSPRAWTRRAVVRVGAPSLLGAAAIRTSANQSASHTLELPQYGWHSSWATLENAPGNTARSV